MSYMKIVSRTLSVLFLTSVITACGFHLRGNIPLPESINNMFVNAENGPFKDQMEEVLLKAGVTIAPSVDAAEVQLNILESTVQRTVGTLDERGKANSYTLVYIVRYVLESPEGIPIRSGVVNDRSQYDFDPDTILETESEEEELIVEMEESVALQIVRQLSTITNYPFVTTN